MTIEDAIAIIESALSPQQLTLLQKEILQRVWKGKSYIKISHELQYNHSYIKDVGASLWQLLSEALGEKVRKHNLKSAISHYQQKTDKKSAFLYSNAVGNHYFLSQFSNRESPAYINSHGNIIQLLLDNMMKSNLNVLAIVGFQDENNNVSGSFSTHSLSSSGMALKQSLQPMCADQLKSLLPSKDLHLLVLHLLRLETP